MNKIPLISTDMVKNTLMRSDLSVREKAEKIAHDINDYYDRTHDGPHKTESADILEPLVLEWEMEVIR